MKIQRADIKPVTFEKRIHYIKKTTGINKGLEILEDTQIPREISDRFAKSKLIQEMSKKFDTYIMYNKQSEKVKNYYQAQAKIFWVNNKRPIQRMEISGVSHSSSLNAVNQMFKSLV